MTNNRVSQSEIVSPVERFAGRHWILLCVGPLLLIAAYQVSKGFLGWHFASRLGRPGAIHWDAFLVLAAALVAAVTLVWQHRRWAKWLPLLAAIIGILASIGVWLQEDRDLLWKGEDVATNNYRAALLVLDNGPLDLIATWNARANPRVDSGYIPQPRELLQRIGELRLGWVIGTRWDRVDLPQDNNRAQMHPPGYPLALAAWLALFGRSRLAALAFELFVKCCLIAAGVTWSWRHIPANDTLNRTAMALLLATSLSTFLFVMPHANELAALLSLGAFALGSEVGNRRPVVYLVSGILLTMAAYTSFFNSLVLISVLGVLAVSRSVSNARLPIASAITAGGAGLVFAGFFVLGYYPWLTYLTGTQVTRYYHLSHPYDLASSLLDYGYLGLPLLLVTALGLLGLTRLHSTPVLPWMVAALLGLAACCYQSFGLGAGARYLTGLFFLLVPLIAHIIRRLSLSVLKVAMIPMASISLAMLLLFL